MLGVIWCSDIHGNLTGFTRPRNDLKLFEVLTKTDDPFSALRNIVHYTSSDAELSEFLSSLTPIQKFKSSNQNVMIVSESTFLDDSKFGLKNKPLSDRRMMIVNRKTIRIVGGETYNQPSESPLGVANRMGGYNTWVIGGAKLYNLFLTYACDLVFSVEVQKVSPNTEFRIKGYVGDYGMINPGYLVWRRKYLSNVLRSPGGIEYRLIQWTR